MRPRGDGVVSPGHDSITMPSPSVLDTAHPQQVVLFSSVRVVWTLRSLDSYDEPAGCSHSMAFVVKVDATGYYTFHQALDRQLDVDALLYKGQHQGFGQYVQARLVGAMQWPGCAMWLQGVASSSSKSLSWACFARRQPISASRLTLGRASARRLFQFWRSAGLALQPALELALCTPQGRCQGSFRTGHLTSKKRASAPLGTRCRSRCSST